MNDGPTDDLVFLFLVLDYQTFVSGNNSQIIHHRLLKQ